MSVYTGKVFIVGSLHQKGVNRCQLAVGCSSLFSYNTWVFIVVRVHREGYSWLSDVKIEGSSSLTGIGTVGIHRCHSEATADWVLILAEVGLLRVNAFFRLKRRLLSVS